MSGWGIVGTAVRFCFPKHIKTGLPGACGPPDIGINKWVKPNRESMGQLHSGVLEVLPVLRLHITFKGIWCYQAQTVHPLLDPQPHTGVWRCPLLWLPPQQVVIAARTVRHCSLQPRVLSCPPAPSLLLYVPQARLLLFQALKDHR